MTMHLAQGLSTINTKKPKQGKLKKTQLKKYKEELRLYNKRLKQNHRHDEMLTIDQYVAMMHGKVEERKPAQYKSATEVKTYQWSMPATYRNTNSQYKSLDTGVGICAKPERKEYTGTLVKGIATMHKSNAVPVLNQEEATDIANMRRN